MNTKSPDISKPDSHSKALILEDINISLQGDSLLSVSAEIMPGEVLIIMGPSGSGKSTLLSYLAGFLAPAFSATGNIFLAGRQLSQQPAETRGIGLLFQDPMLFPHLSVAGNLRFALPAKADDKEKIIAEGLSQMDLDGFGNRDPGTLSGGQQARVALLRLLLSRPKAVLLDEPFSKLDTDLRQSVREQVFNSLQQAQLPTILVTHDSDDAAAAKGRIIEL